MSRSRIAPSRPAPALRRFAAALALLGPAAALGADTPVPHHGGAEPQILAPGYRELEFEPAEPGSYRLPPLGEAGDGRVIDSEGREHRLHELLSGKVALVSFIYTRCNDVNGCPLASYVMSQTARRLAREPAIARHTRLLSLSFDPAYDTPEVMAEYASRYDAHGTDWRFLTPGSEAALDPILEAYGQAINREVDAEGNTLSTISHVLRVYLIDPQQRIRNIYSIAFLHADSVLNDIRTVLLEDAERAAVEPRSARLQGPGDARQGYETPGYRTDAADLTGRRGEPAPLLALARQPKLGLPDAETLGLDAITEAQVALGRKLFFDRRLSHNGTISCAMCHIPEQGFTSNELATAVGIEGRSVRRSAPTLYNVALLERLFHDGRESELTNQVWSPLLAHNEMGNPAVGMVTNRLRRLPDYEGLFEAAFDGRAADMQTVGEALAAYEKTLLSADSAFDRYYYGGDLDAMSDAAHRGLALFTGKGGCSSCHLIEKDHAPFTDNALHNTGIGYANSMLGDGPAPKVQLAPGEFVAVDPEVLANAGEGRPNDLGRYEITGDPDDRWKYRTPTLRNVALTAPYMHNGALPTLEAVVDFYNRGGVPNPLIDPRIRPLGLSEREQGDLVAFLRALTGDNVDTLVTDAFAAPVGDPE